MILLLDNYDSFTWNLVQRFGELDPTLRMGQDLLVVRNDKLDPADVETIDGGRPPSHIVISPGPGTPDESGVSRELIARFQGRVPILGVCLGHQCLADLHGLDVARHRVQMHGKTSDIHHDGTGVFAGLPDPFAATRYHSLIVPIDQIPEPPREGGDGWRLTAWALETDEAGREVKAVMGLRRVFAEPDALPVEGVQFHPESFLTGQGPRLLANFLASGDRPRPADPARLSALLAQAPMDV